MIYTLLGDRDVEYKFTTRFMDDGHNRWMLDVGPGPRGRLAHYACLQGWKVIGVCLEGTRLKGPGYQHVRKDFLSYWRSEPFDLAICVSSLEHFGMPGRYGISRVDFDADLKAMTNIAKLVRQGADVVITVPVGLDAWLQPYHRVYGKDRLPVLLDGFRIKEEAFYAKWGELDVYQETDKETALNTEPLVQPKRYYAIGCFCLEVESA